MNSFKKRHREYINSDKWRKKKESYYSKYEKKCFICGDEKVDLHHRSYSRFGKEKHKDLIPVCRFHHEMIHRIQKDNNWTVKRATKYLTKMWLSGPTQKLSPSKKQIRRQKLREGID